MARDSYSSSESSMRDYQEKPVFKSHCKRRQSITTESSDSSPSSKQPTSEKLSTTSEKEMNHVRGRKMFKRQTPNSAGIKHHEMRRSKEKLALSIQNRQPVPDKEVTREDVTREIMKKYHVEAKKGWLQRVKEWLGSQPDVTPPCKVPTRKKEDERERTSAKVRHNMLTTKKNTTSEENKKVDQYNEKFIKTTSGKVQKKRRRKEGENSSTAVNNYDMAAGEKPCKKSELREKKKQQKRKLWQDADKLGVKKQKIHVLMPESKSPGWSVLKAINLIKFKGKQATPRLIHYVVTEKLNRPFITKKNVDELLKLMLEKNLINSEMVEGTTVFSTEIVCWQQ